MNQNQKCFEHLRTRSENCNVKLNIKTSEDIFETPNAFSAFLNNDERDDCSTPCKIVEGSGAKLDPRKPTRNRDLDM